MPYLNRIILMGHAGKAPEIKTTQGGLTIATFGLATDDGYFDKQNRWVSKVTWHNCVAMGKVGDLVAKRPFAAGDVLLVEGSVVDNSYEKEGRIIKSQNVRCQGVKLVKAKEPKPRQETIIPPQLDEPEEILPF